MEWALLDTALPEMNTRFAMRWLIGATLAVVITSGTSARADDAKMKVAFIYVGPISDNGWTRSNEEGRKAAVAALPWLDASYVESVTDGDVESYIDQMVSQGNKVIFTTSTSFMDGTIDAATRYPDVLFFNSNGLKRAPNVATYQSDPYQCNYLEGMIDAALSKTGKVGMVSAYPVPDVVREADAIALGIRAVNPKGELLLRWLNTWYNPPAEKEAAESLVLEGADALASTMDSPTVEEVANTRGVPVNGHSFYGNVAMLKTEVSGDIYNWAPIFIDILQKVHDGVYTSRNLQNVDLWLRLGDHTMELAYKKGVPLNPAYVPKLKAAMVDDGKGGKISAYDLIMLRLGQMSQKPPQFEPFTGPIVDATGKVRVPAGQTATQAQMFSLTWRLPNMVGNWPLTP
jgi:simple sugar transport system substrate-binding protein